MSSVTLLARRTLGVALIAAGCSAHAQDDRVVFAEPAAAPAEIADAMWALRGASHRLDAELREAGSWWPRPDAERVAKALTEMRRIAGTLAVEPVAQRDPRIAERLPAFLALLDRAEQDVSSASPRFDWAGEVAAGCELCHDRMP